MRLPDHHLNEHFGVVCPLTAIIIAYFSEQVKRKMLITMNFDLLHKTPSLILVNIHRNEVFSEMSTIFWERFTEACEKTNQKPTGVCRKLGLSSGNPPAWKQGRVPNMEIMQKLANYFEVPVSYFLGETEKAPDAEAAGAKKDLRYALFEGAEVSDETFEKVMAFARFALEEERRQKGE